MSARAPLFLASSRLLSASLSLSFSLLADHFTVFLVHAGLFDCATNRQRVIIVGFSDRAHLAKFGDGPKPWTERPRPIKGIVRTPCPRALFLSVCVASGPRRAFCSVLFF